MSDQFTTIGPKRQRRLTKIVKKHEKKELLTLDKIHVMRDTPFDPKTFKRHARQYFATQMLGTRMVLSHPFTDVHGRHLKSVVLDFSKFKKDGYVHVQPFHPVNDNHYGMTEVDYRFWLHVKSHRDLYKKLLTHKLL
ncbi:hypothetical protein [Flagellimonas amoyensis]|uniref:hypothetical protein n=1 Tax=Flagellimonas amoyensis TaxID=2169401 RepID=UPI00131EF1D8|nr:hypothetical protein [Allomuricauda amoyensis]